MDAPESQKKEMIRINKLRVTQRNPQLID